MHHLTSLGLSHVIANRTTLTGAERKQWMQKWLMFLHSCRIRGETPKASPTDPVAWCIPDEEAGRLRELVPPGPTANVFYDRLAALKAAGPRSLDYPDA